MPGLPTYKSWPADLVVETTQELIQCYDRGFRGAFRDPIAEEELYSEMEYKTFEDVSDEHGMAGDGEGKLSLAYATVLKLNPLEYHCPAQRTGSCVSRSTVNAFTASYSYEVWNGIPDEVKGLPGEASSVAKTRRRNDGPRSKKKKKDNAAELTQRYNNAVAEAWPSTPYPDQQTFDHVTIYGERGHRGQGANCSTLARAASTKTGLLPRGEYDIPGFGKYNCSKYDDNAAARSGPNWSAAFRKFTNEHRVRAVTGVRTIEGARDALANNYGLSVCSGFACASRRPSITDSNGNTCAGPNVWKGSWSHAMAWIACDDREWAHQKYGGPLFLICNSWGTWNSGPRRIYDTDLEIPLGCMWVDSKTAQSILRGGGGFVLADIKGFPRRPLIVDFW